MQIKIMQFNIITIFPELIDHYSSESILGRAQNSGKIKINSINLRDYTNNKHNKVDDTPYGGGAGMVMNVEPVFNALDQHNFLPDQKSKKTHTVLLSPRGRKFTQRVAEEFSEKYENIVMVCGRYEGVDQRVADHLVDEEISVGDFVLAGGELVALAVTEATARLITGVLGNKESIKEETFSKEIDVEYPQYTKPEQFKDWKVPEVLLSGNHAEIEKWRKNQPKEK